MSRLALAMMVGILVLLPGCSSSDGDDEASGGASASGTPGGEGGAEERPSGSEPGDGGSAPNAGARAGGGGTDPSAGAPSQGGATPGGSPDEGGSPARAGAENGTAGSETGIDLVSCDREVLGAPCTDGTTHSDCGCDATYCAVPPGATAGMCTRTGCTDDPSLCPEGYGCLDLSTFQPGLPSLCQRG